MFVYKAERKSCITKSAILCIGNLFECFYNCDLISHEEFSTVKRGVQQNFLTVLLVERGHVCTNLILCGPSIVCYWIVLYTFQAITEGLLAFFPR